MLLRLSTLFIFFLLCEAATKIGLGNGRPSEEPSSLKTEVLKFKTSECGSSSFEESTKKKQKNRRKNQDDEDEDDSEEDAKRRRNKGRNRGRGFREEYLMYGRSYEMGRTDTYNNRQDPFQQRWDESYNNRNRNQYSPYYGNNEDEFYQNRRNNNRDRTPERPGPYNNRDRDQDNFNNQRPRQHNNRNRYNYQEDDRHNNNNRDDRNNRKKHNNDWEEEDDDYGRKGNRRQSNRHQNNRNKKRKNNDDNNEECVSQCVFNNMEIMEDDGIPSEAGMIKWAQEKIKNEKLKQTAVKEIRRCFGTLASSDGDNSCNFSKSLANCLKLGLDEDKE